MKLPPNMYARQYLTQRGVKRVRYYCRYTDVRGQRRIEPLGSTLESARAKYHEIMESVERGEDRAAVKERSKAAVFSYWSQQWLDLTQHKRSHSKDQEMVTVLRHFFGEVQLSAITTDRIEAYKAHRRQQRSKHGRLYAPATINRELGALRSILTLAQQSGLIRDRPVIRRFRENNERDRIISEEEYHRILSAMLPRYRGVLTIMWELGAREGEVVGLTWPHIHLPQQTLTFAETKTGESRTVPMSPVVEALLRATPSRRAQTEHVFDVNLSSLKTMFKRTMKRIGLRDVWLHDFRRSFITRKQLEGWNYKQIMLITGHKDLRIFDRYNKPSFADVRAVVSGTRPTRADAPAVQ